VLEGRTVVVQLLYRHVRVLHQPVPYNQSRQIRVQQAQAPLHSESIRCVGLDSSIAGQDCGPSQDLRSCRSTGAYIL
jgi:hypothetical protein